MPIAPSGWSPPGANHGAPLRRNRLGGTGLDEPAQKRGQATRAEVIEAHPRGSDCNAGHLLTQAAHRSLERRKLVAMRGLGRGGEVLGRDAVDYLDARGAS